MAFKNKNLSVIAYANGFTMWHYITDDNYADINEDYFHDVADLMAKGDMFILNTKDGSRIAFITSLENRKVRL